MMMMIMIITKTYFVYIRTPHCLTNMDAIAPAPKKQLQAILTQSGYYNDLCANECRALDEAKQLAAYTSNALLMQTSVEKRLKGSAHKRGKFSSSNEVRAWIRRLCARNTELSLVKHIVHHPRRLPRSVKGQILATHAPLSSFVPSETPEYAN